MSSVGGQPPALPGHSIEVIINEAELAQRVEKLAADLTNDYAGQDPIFVCVLKGAFMFMTDLVRCLEFPLSVEFLRVSSYGNNVVTTGEVKMELDLQNSIANRHVILVEDIVDTGLTLEYLKKNLMARNPASMRICALLHKPTNNVKISTIDYVGFNIPSEFVVGYGLDYQGYYRNLPYIARVTELK